MSGFDPLSQLPQLAALATALRVAQDHPAGRALAAELDTLAGRAALPGNQMPAEPFAFDITPGDAGTFVIIVGPPGSGRVCPTCRRAF